VRVGFNYRFGPRGRPGLRITDTIFRTFRIDGFF
jgi:hypothetical protein